MRVLLVFLGLVLTGCAAEPVDHNSTDVLFTHRMIAHNAQSVQAARLVQGRTVNARVIKLATQIEQGALNPQLAEWASRWESSPDDAGSVPGEIKNLGELTGLSGYAFTSRWLDTMIVHHRGAITMAENELSHGKNAAAKAFAQQVLDSRQPRLAEMQGMTGG
ncbi:DUF305 domain-containing protein [Kibdelosporangium aridum]|uniref:DUF305 domain-containing protein n=1 Tax=Kibdelosporangium aridum TaxID=2030 RepID=A0A428ZEL1_KIBAR|nr:DUF305 domain-containing protein [Kibdelosporangium aridum]RSM86543.1 DUF305 domain-containing protein [Kibdelosporangium aridum]